MDGLTAIIIEDEKNAREALAGLLGIYCPQVLMTGQAATIEAGMKLIRENKPKLVFLDIAIGEQDGFELLDQLDTIDFQVIFTTAYSEFAIRAFRYNAVDYLLKPIESDQLIAAVQKVSHTHNFDQLHAQMAYLLKALQTQKNDKLVIPTLEETHFLALEDILHIKGDANYSTFFLHHGEQILASKPLKYYQGILPPTVFFRSHQSHLVNITFIRKIITQDGYRIELQNGATIPLARSRKEALMRLLQ